VANIRTEGVPDGVDIANIKAALAAVEGVPGIHDLHVWSISSGKTSLAVYVVHAATLAPAIMVERMRGTAIVSCFQLLDARCRARRSGTAMPFE
jgi:cobalt-zinc-cadmium efflux system protein